MALFDLAEIQRCIHSGELDEDAVEIRTTDCERDLRQLQWSYGRLLQFLLALRPYALSGETDFKSAQWCMGSDGLWYPCDAYATYFDPFAMERARSGVSIYLKFSIPEDGECVLITLSAHD